MALANRQEAIRDAGGEILGMFYYDVVKGIKTSAEESSEMMDAFGWRGGWRIEDTDDLDLMKSAGTGGGQESLFFVRYPIVYVIETATMKVYAGEKLYDYDDEGMEVDVIAAVKEIAEKNK